MSLVTVSLSHYNISGKGPRISERHINILKNEAEKLSLFKFTKHKSFKYWNAKDKYVFLMSNKDPMLILNTAIFIQKCLFPTWNDIAFTVFIIVAI